MRAKIPNQHLVGMEYGFTSYKEYYTKTKFSTIPGQHCRVIEANGEFALVVNDKRGTYQYPVTVALAIYESLQENLRKNSKKKEQKLVAKPEEGGPVEEEEDEEA